MASLTITAQDFEDRAEGLYFTGDLAAGRAIVESDNHVFEGTNEHGGYTVRFSRTPDVNDYDEWGTSQTGDKNEAWRYALGAAFGPYDYDEPATTLTTEG